MPTLIEKLTEDMKTAMKAGEKDKLSTIRMILAETKNRRIDKKVDVLADPDVIDVLSSMKKKRAEAAETYEKGGRPELAEKERGEIVVIDSYLPQQLTEAEIEKIIANAIAKTGASSPKDMGKVMGIVSGQTKGRADGGAVSAMVKKKLAG